jgi:hypothetical protein
MNTLEDLLTYLSNDDDGEHQSNKSRCHLDRRGSDTMSEISVISLLELGIPIYIKFWPFSVFWLMIDYCVSHLYNRMFCIGTESKSCEENR